MSTVKSKVPGMVTIDFEQGHLDATFLYPPRMSVQQREQHLSRAVVVQLDEKQLAVYGIEVVVQATENEYGSLAPEVIGVCVDPIADDHPELRCNDATLAITR